ncbi:DinB family protein [Aneurinibacillus aneurinilyticus]|nr:DinB family protein [Aneurinibacillus aneurinilyticus]MED0707748.1 DinB family protein [Aneurinibacillus aneurinilyticus]MED0722413.1 DinB family protein [Aneurinibacillus aneurinilyticus]MED0733111.1 DinB family protein [Aneurinibacillus aneurinilyticus]MED0743087.1 DinB family protein [Aneurinibacillus aneurinilyticus]
MKHNTLQLYDYHVWANDKVLQHLKELPEETCRAEITSVFPSIHDALVHMFVVDTIWLGAISGDSFEEIRISAASLPEKLKDNSIGEMEQLFFDLSSRYQTFFRHQQDLGAVASYDHPHFGTLMARYSDIIQHVVNHGTYHRGNITAMLQQLGHSGTSTDYVFYLYSINNRS